MKELTKAEEQVMKVIWSLKKATIKEVTRQMPEPQPAYNTVATVLKVLKAKGFVEHEAQGNIYTYFPLVAEKKYRHFAFDKVLNTYFNNSYQSLVSFLVEEKKLDKKTHDRLVALTDKLKEK